MLLDPSAGGWVSSRTRLLTYALIAYCSTMVLFGPSAAELALAALGCGGRLGSMETSCYGLALLPASTLAPWLSVVPPVETLFLLLEQTWLIGAVWLALIAFSMRLDRRPKPLAVVQHEAREGSQLNAAPSAEKPSFAAQQADWVRQKEAEQTQQQEVDQLSLHRRILLEGGLWGSLSILLIVLIGGLAAFCVAFGMPLLGGISAESLLRTFSCSDLSLMDANPWSGVCGSLTHRLEPYLQPFFGALFAPIWLFTEFSDVLLIWMASILSLTLLFVYRLGWMTVLKNTSPFVQVGSSIVFIAALIGQLHALIRVVPPPIRSDGGLGALPGGIDVLITMALGAVMLLVSGVIALIILAIYLARQFSQARHLAFESNAALKSEPPAF